MCNATNAPAIPATPPADAARAVARRLRAAGFQALWAGGCVRDLLLGRAPKDYDVATAARPDTVLELFPDALAVGKSFGVVRVPLGGVWTEVATFRIDRGYADGRRPDAVEFTDAPTDALRRDFTVNAMFLDPETGVILDTVGGRRDLAARLIRCVGVAAERFAEDHLRLLRAVRFAATLEFALEADTAAAIRTCAGLIARVSAERVRDELLRLLCEAPRAGAAVRLLDEVALLGEILPEIKAMRGVAQPPQFHPEGDVFTHTCLMLDAMPPGRSTVLALAVLLHDVGKPPTAQFDGARWRFYGHAPVGARLAEDILRRLRCPTADIEAVGACVRGHMRYAEVRRMRPASLRRLIGNPLFDTELELHRLDCGASHHDLGNHAFLVEHRRAYADKPVLPAPWVTGADLMALGLPCGKAVGHWKQRAYDAQLEGRYHSREALLQWIAGELHRGAG